VSLGSLQLAEDLARRLAAAARSATLYAPDHPVVQRGVDALAGLCASALRRRGSIVLGVVDDALVIDGQRLERPTTSLVGFVRDLRAQEIARITIGRGITRQDLHGFVSALADRSAPLPLGNRLEARKVRGVVVRRTASSVGAPLSSISAARRVYAAAVRGARSIWEQACAERRPDPDEARRIIESLARLLSRDRTSLIALTAPGPNDDFTFTHMVNVAILAMAQARSLSIEGALLREFGFAALMHDIGKVSTPGDILNKPGPLTAREFAVMKRHVIDGASILHRTPGVPALAPIVAFEHHLGQDLSGYPENIGHRELNLCTQIVSIADVYDALRSNRVYRPGLPAERVRAIMARRNSPAFNGLLLRRFINLVGLFPVGTLVRLETGEVAVVNREHANDPFRPQVRVLLDEHGDPLMAPELVNTWEPRASRRSVVEEVDPDSVQIDPLEYLS
jgi:putative nucleotidyltransferase with HDIG domain